jgi:hypothetical protein
MSIVLQGSTSGSVTLQEPAIAGTTVIDLPATSGTMVVTGGAQTVQFAAGSASTPSITTTGDTNTGIFFPAADTIAFSEGGAEAMRIDSSGNLIVGRTDLSNTVGVDIRANGLIKSVRSGSTNADDTLDVYSTGAGAFRFYVGMGGTIFATSTTISAISDQRLKENVRNLDFGLPQIMALQPRKFDWKEGKGLNKKDDVGFIAQEFETVFPSSVDTSKAGADGIEYKTVNHSELIPTLVKAIQELKAQLDESNLILTSVKTELDTVKATVEAQAVRIAELEGAK